MLLFRHVFWSSVSSWDREQNPGADAGFWSEGPVEFWPQRVGLNPKFAQNRGFPLKLPENFMTLKTSWGVWSSRPPGPPGSASGTACRTFTFRSQVSGVHLQTRLYVDFWAARLKARCGAAFTSHPAVIVALSSVDFKRMQTLNPPCRWEVHSWTCCLYEA